MHKHRLKFNPSASLLNELLRDFDTVLAPFIPYNGKIQQFSADFNHILVQVFNLNYRTIA
jgi:hypothetical protein